MASLKVEQKRKKARQNILNSALPYIESGEYTDMTIRELCDRLEITTGLFYQYYSSKDDLLAFYSLDMSEKLYDEASEQLSGMTLKERLLHICLINMESMKAIGPDSILIHLNTTNPYYNCHVSRSMFQERVREAFDSVRGAGCYSEEEMQRTSDSLLILQKGLDFEWYSRRDDPDFDLMKTSEEMLVRMLDSLDIE